MTIKIQKDNSAPLVSVLIPIYNAELYVEKAILSIIEQSYQNLEIICIDDGSNDITKDILNKLARIDNRIILISRENKGLVFTLNEGIDVSTGKYIARMDADDISVNTRIAKQVEYMEKHQECAVCGTFVQYFGETNSLKQADFFNNNFDLRGQIFLSTPIAHPSAMIRKNLLTIHSIKYNKAYRHAEDLKFWTELIKIGSFYNVPERLLKYRITPDQISNKHSKSQYHMAQKIRHEYLLYISKLLGINVNNIKLKDLRVIESQNLFNPKFLFYYICFMRNETSVSIRILILTLYWSKLSFQPLHKSFIRLFKRLLKA